MSSTTSSSGSSLNEVTWLPIVKAVMSASACHDDGAVKAGLLHASVLASPRSAASPLIGYERALLPLCGDVPSGHKTGYARYEDVPQSLACEPPGTAGYVPPRRSLMYINSLPDSGGELAVPGAC